MANTASHTAKQLLNDQIEILSQLKELLLEEYEALKSSQNDAVTAISERKRNLVQDLEVLNRGWQDFLRGQGSEFSVDGIGKCMEALDKSGAEKLAELWSNMSDVSRECQKQNTINGAVVTLRQQVTQQALDILRGQTMGGGDIYDSKGSAHSGGSLGNTIAKA